MRIALLAPLVETVPPVGYGGTELVVSLLTEELVRRGHDVTLFASGDSKTNARLIAVEDMPLRNHIRANRWPAYDIQMLLKLEQMQDEFDIVHNHMGYQALPYFRNLNCPIVSTNHNLVKGYVAPIYLAFKHLPYIAISNAYRQLNYPDELNYVAVVHNGIEIDKHVYDPAAERSYLLFVGRICADKGTAAAIEVAQRLKLPLRIAGKVDSNDKSYYESQVAPKLADPSIQYLGEVGFEQKAELFTKAIALIYPIAFEEPFGLVMAEALASGTPVLAFNRGSVAEVLSDPDTAIIGDTVDELVARFPQLNEISRSACRQRAVDLFSKECMTDKYEAIYRELIEGSLSKSLIQARICP